MLRKSAVRWAGSGVLRRSLPSLAAVRTYHAVFGLPFGLDVDTAALQKSYHQLQRGAHPDVAPGTGGAGTSIGAHDDGDSIEANKAYEVLRNNYRRARYVSQLIRALRQSEKKGLPGDGASAADWAEMACDHKDPEAAPLPPDLLGISTWSSPSIPPTCRNTSMAGGTDCVRPRIKLDVAVVPSPPLPRI